MASAQAIAPKPLAAPMVWPSIDLIELIGGGSVAEHVPDRGASAASLAGVPVPCAQM